MFKKKLNIYTSCTDFSIRIISYLYIIFFLNFVLTSSFKSLGHFHSHEFVDNTIKLYYSTQKILNEEFEHFCKKNFFNIKYEKFFSSLLNNFINKINNCERNCSNNNFYEIYHYLLSSNFTRGPPKSIVL